MQQVPIKSLGLITSTTTAARITAADTSFSANDTMVGANVVRFQWVSGTVTIGASGVTTAGAAGFCVLDTTSRIHEFHAPQDQNSLPVKDFWCVGSGTFICCYQCA